MNETLLARGRRGDALGDLAIVDMHAHFGRYMQAIPDLSAEGLIRVMDRLGVASVMVSHMQCTSLFARRGNDEVAAVMRAYPGRVRAYAVVSPVGPPGPAAELKRCLALGFSGLKIHTANSFAYTDPAYAGAFEIAAERRLPVLLHTWGAEADFKAVRELAARYSGAAFLIAHSGAGNGETECIRVARELPNVYLDLAYSMGPRGLVARLVNGAGADKLVYGSDCYFFSMQQQVGKVLGAAVTDADKRRILSTNARGLLERVVPSGA